MSRSIFIKLIICSIFVIVLSSSFCIPKTFALGDIFSSGKDFLSIGNNIDETLDMDALEGTSDYIYNTLLAIGIMVAIVIAMVLGIQFMAASAEEKAKVKEALIPFVVGCVVVFGAFTIWKVVVNMGNDAEGSIGPSSEIKWDPVWDTVEGIKDYLDKNDDLSNISDSELIKWRAEVKRLPYRGENPYLKEVETEMKKRGIKY